MAEDPGKTALETERNVAVTGDLLLVTGPGAFQSHRLLRDEIKIGRAADCDVVIDHKALSRYHATLRVKPSLAIQDLGSTNGTRVAGAVRKGGEPTTLVLGESFHIGPFAFLVVASGSNPRVAQGPDPLLVEDPTEERVSPFIREIAASDVNVLVLGETGAGKEVLANTLHTLSGRKGPFTRINCAALSESLLESELFGHEKGAFTGAVASRAGLLEAAVKGTVFLDEIGEMPLGIQAKLLRAVEAREVLRLGSTRPVAIDVRFIAATNRDLDAEIDAGKFRQDLFFRLDGVTLRIPPLRARRHSIGILAMRFLELAGEKLGRRIRVAPEVFSVLEAHDWPGNVRELKAVIERAVLLARGDEVSPAHLSFARGGETRSATASSPPAPTTASETGEDAILAMLTAEQRADREEVVAALVACNGNQTRAAKLLDISRSTLVTKMALYRIPRPRV